MGIFQKSVINKHLKTLDDKKVKAAYEQFKEFYGNKIRLHNIMQLKEENYQEGFLREVFVDTLGYTINPNENYNLTTEYKNLKDARKADGAVLKNGKAIGVIELKSTKTKNLESIKEQAFGYKNNQPGCKYVITSNFQKLRLYIDNSTEYKEFDLFQMDVQKFKVFWLLLNKESLFRDLPDKLKKETKFHENDVSAKLYKDYTRFKENIFHNLIKNNPEYDKLTLFKKSQKLLDRFLFMLFSEDSGLIPPNTVSKIVHDWEQLKKLDAYAPLYNIFKKYFSYLDKGKDISDWGTVPAYNGGLFKPDEVLDNSNVKIDDEILEKDSLNLSRYDFNTEVDVNILGHIFEHSLNEIEQISAKLKGEAIDKKKTKRKKDGIFYTPKYITKYIVENTVGTLCKEKKQELDIDNLLIDETYRKTDGKLKKKGKQLFDTLNTYKKWLLKLKILDPACGSGAFLNQTLDFLMTEHQEIDDRIAELEGKTDTLRLHDTDKSILENNIYGVDINEESVEIAKLALWLRTAQRGRPLSDLSGNIKCGNSLIDDPEIAGDKAFDWNVEFKEIMDNGGFDVVIGNPPYVDIKSLEHDLTLSLFKKFKTAENRINLYSLFIEQAYYLVKEKGFVSFINPNSILVNSSYTKIRKLLIKSITKIIKLPDDVFPDAKVETIILELRKLTLNNNNVFVITYPKDAIIETVDNSLLKKISKSSWANSEGMNYNIYISDEDISLLKKIAINTVQLSKVADFSLGITPYDKYKGHTKKIIQNKEFHSDIKIDNSYKPLISGENIQRYYISPKEKGYIKYGEWLGAMRESRFFIKPRIIVRQIISGNPPRIYAGYTEDELYFTQIGFAIIIKGQDQISTKFITALLNSNLINFYHKYQFLDIEKRLFQKILIANCKKFPIKVIPKEAQQPFIKKADQMLFLNKESHKKSERFLKRVTSNFEIEKFSKKLQNFYEYDFKTFLAELKKQKIKLSLTAQDEWEEYFDSYKKEINVLQSQISQTDQEIDQMVYELYGLTDEEIGIVEGSVK